MAGWLSCGVLIYVSRSGRRCSRCHAVRSVTAPPSREAFQAKGLDPLDFKGEAITFKVRCCSPLSFKHQLFHPARPMSIMTSSEEMFSHELGAKYLNCRRTKAQLNKPSRKSFAMAGPIVFSANLPSVHGCIVFVQVLSANCSPLTLYISTG